MKELTFKTRKGQNPNTTITLPTGQPCKYNDGKYTTADPEIAGWLQKLGYKEYKKPAPKTRKRKPKK